MAKQIINIGSTANDGTGDPIRTAFQKAMSNFDELYTGSTADVDSLIAGAGISVDQATGNVTVTNTAPDQTVTLTSGANVTITGTYPNFTISSDDVVGAVNSVNGQAGVVVLDSADIAEDTNLYYTEARVSANTNVAANTAKTGITTQQATDITTNNAKDTFPGFGTSAGTSLEGNTSLLQVGTLATEALAGNTTTISTSQAADIVTNNAKNTDQTVTLTQGANVTITGTYPDFTIASDDVVGAVNSVNGQAGVVVLDTADISEDTNLYYTEARVEANSAVALNTVKVGITTGQASAIVTNTGKTSFPGFGTAAGTSLEGDTALLALGTSNTTALAGDTTTISVAQAGEITANTAKTGITAQQTSDITANNAKDTANTANVTSAGALMDSEVTNLADVKAFDTTDYLASSVTTITTQQAGEITANNAKTGITSAQAGEITANNSKVTNATHTGDVTGDGALTIVDDKVITSKILDLNVTTDKVANDAITYDKLGVEFTTTGAVTTALNFTANQVFTKTMTADTTFTYSNVGIGMVKDFILTGAFVPTFPSGTKTVAGTYDNIQKIACTV